MNMAIDAWKYLSGVNLTSNGALFIIVGIQKFKVNKTLGEDVLRTEIFKYCPSFFISYLFYSLAWKKEIRFWENFSLSFYWIDLRQCETWWPNWIEIGTRLYWPIHLKKAKSLQILATNIHLFIDFLRVEWRSGGWWNKIW